MTFTPDPKNPDYKSPLGRTGGTGDILVAIAGEFYWVPTNLPKLDELIGELFDQWNFGNGHEETKILLDGLYEIRKNVRSGEIVKLHGVMGDRGPVAGQGGAFFGHKR